MEEHPSAGVPFEHQFADRPAGVAARPADD